MKIFPAFFFVIVLISGCSKIEKPVTIQFFHYKQNNINEINQMVSVFHKRNPNILIEIESLSFDINNVLKSRFESGDAPDLIMLSSMKMIDEFAKAGYILDLTKERCTSRLLNSVKMSLIMNNRIYAYPMNMKGLGIFFNKEMFDGIPETAPLFAENCVSLSKNNIIPFVISGKEKLNYAFLFSYAHSISLNLSGMGYKDWMMRMNEGTESFGNKKMQVMIRALEIYGFYDKDNYTDINGLLQDFNDSKTASMIGESVLSGRIKINAGFMAIPLTDKKEDARLFCEPEASLVVSSKSMPEKIEAVKKFLDFLSSDAAVKILSSTCKFIPSVRNADASQLETTGQNLYKYMIDNKTMPYYFNQYPPNVFELSKSLTDNFLDKKMNYPALIKSLDDEWRKNTVSVKK